MPALPYTRIAIILLGLIYIYYECDINMKSLPKWVATSPTHQISTPENPQPSADLPLFGVYTPVDPSTYADIYPHDAKPHVKEIADLFTKIILQFVDMRYLEKEQVHLPPHTNPRINNSHPARYGFTKDVVDLYQMIPYVVPTEGRWNHGSDSGEFIMWGEFLGDLRDTGESNMNNTWLDNVIDPFYGIQDLTWELATKGLNKQSSWDAAGQAPYIKPWYAVLSHVGNHGSVMILDTREMRVWLVEQIGGSTDPLFWNGAWQTGSAPIVETLNTNDLAQYPSRDAKEFLEDITERWRSLTWIPGGLYKEENDWEGNTEHARYKQIYKEAGWPDAFSAVRFDELYDDWQREKDEYSEMTRPLEQLDSLRTLDILLSEPGRPPLAPEKWEEQQSALRAKLERSQKWLEQVLARTAGLSEEDSARETSRVELEIAELEALLLDEDPRSRNARLIMEARRKARSVPIEVVDRWIREEAARGWGRANDKSWEMTFRSFLGSS